MSAASTPRRDLVHRLYSQHHGWLLGSLRRRIRNNADAEDLAADTFCTVLAARFEPALIEEPRAYLVTIAKRLAFRLFRRRELEQAYLERLALLPELFAPSEEERAILMEAINRIDRALQGLPVAVKAAFLYHQLDGLGQSEIAGLLGVSTKTVQRHLKAAMRRCYLLELDA